MLVLTIVLAALGLALFLTGLLLLSFREGQPMTEQEVADLQARGVAGRGLFGRSFSVFRGRGVGRQVHVEVSFDEIRKALRNRAWANDPRWRAILLALAGAVLLLIGGFGIVLAATTGIVRFIAALVALYVLVQIARGVRRSSQTHPRTDAS